MSFDDFNDDNFDENDEELLRELAEIETLKTTVKKAAHQSGFASSSTSKAGGSRAGKPTIEEQLLGNADIEVDDDDLEAELNAIIESEVPSSNESLQQQSVNKESTTSTADRSSGAEFLSSQAVTPYDVERQAAQVPQLDVVSNLPLHSQPAALPVVTKPNSPEISVPRSTPASSEENPKMKAKKLLLRRREAYAVNAQLAVEDGNSEYAKECAETVLMFDQALEACNEQAVTIEDLEEIPTTPPPYKKKLQPPKPGTLSLEQELRVRISKFEELAADFERKSDTGRARMQRRLGDQLKSALRGYLKEGRIQPDLLPVPIGFEKLSPLAAEASSNTDRNTRLSAPSQVVTRSANSSPVPAESSQPLPAETLQEKVLKYKKAALVAKKRGDLTAAAKYLQAAKAVEKEANLLLPSASSAKSLPDSDRTEVQITPSSKLFANLKHQLEMVMKLRTQFHTIKDVKRTLFYDELIKKCTTDLKVCHHEVKMGHDALMKYKINKLNLPVLEINPGISVDTLEIKIVSIKNVKMPDGWKPADAQNYVTYDFPFPHDAHQTGRTQIVYKTNNPEFQESFQLKINRKTKQLQRICQRMPIKLTAYQKGGFLRSDKFCGEADISFGDICNQATLYIEQDLLDRRKKTGATITVEVKVQKPLDEKKMNSTKVYPWIRLD